MDKTVNAPNANYVSPHAPITSTRDILHSEKEQQSDDSLRNSLLLLSPDSKSRLEQEKRPSLLLIHCAIIAAQVSFGGGSAIAALGLPSTNPVLFALIRESIAGPLLCLLAYALNREIPKLKHAKLFILPGIALFLNQLCFILGLKISSAIMASAWQPAQGILAVVYGYCLRTEKHMDLFKIGGILVSFGGAAFMVLYGDNHDTSGNAGAWNTIGGSVMFFINCSATVFYLILSKPLYKRYKSSTITGYAYMVASLLMVVTAFTVANVYPLLHFVCSDCGHDAWNVPTITIYALIYWILFESLLSYLLLTWANTYSPPSVNVAYSVLQPLTAVVVSEFILAFHWVSQCHANSSDNANNCLYAADWNDLGAIGIAIGLFFVVYSQHRHQKSMKQKTLKEPQYNET